MTEDEHDALAERYRKMSDTGLMDVARAYDGLVDSAKALIREEFARRSLDPPLREEEEPRPRYQNLVTVARYRDLTEAIVARSVLESAGLTCFLQDENTIRMDWALSNLLGGLRLQVADQDVEVAMDLLNEPIRYDPNFKQPVCPKCGSLEVALHTRDRKLAMTSWLVLGVPLPAFSKHPEDEAWQCLNCGCVWTDTGETQNPTPHGPLL